MTFKIKDELLEVIRSSWFTVEEGTYVYTKVEDVHHPEDHLLVARDSDEVTVLTEKSNLEKKGAYERNPDDWTLINIKCGNPFYCKGFIAAIASVFAGNNMDITITSTYTNDYIMVQSENIADAIKTLTDLGFTQKAHRL